MNWKLVASVALIGSAFLAVPGCAVDAASDSSEQEGDSEETAATADELTANAQRLVGAFHFANGGSMRPPTFEGLVFQQNGVFFADIDTGIRCVVAPCPSNVRLLGKFTATKSYVRLNPVAGEPAHAFHGRYKYTLVNDKLTLTRTGSSWNNWKGVLEKEFSYCAQPTDCDGQGLIHVMCVGSWTCSEERSCGYKCGVPTPTNVIWPADKKTLVAETPGGGFTPPPPPGSTCAIGKAKYTLDIASRKLAWEECDWNGNNTPLHLVTGTTTLTTAEMATVNAAMNDVTLSAGDICGADKPMLTIKVTSPSQGTKTYTDSFYSCMGGNRTYVDNIDGVFGALRTAAH
jgi:hypothetical protein